MNRFIIYLFLLISGMTISCNSFLSGDPGNGSETIAVIEGQLFTLDGFPAKDAVIKLIHSDYIPGSAKDTIKDSYITMSDTNGYYLLTPEIKTEQHYNLQVNDLQNGLGVAHHSIFFINNKASFYNDTVRKYGSAMVKLPDGLTAGTLIMRGTTCNVVIDEIAKKLGYISFDSIPAGACGPIEYMPSAAGTNIILSDEVKVLPGVKTMLKNLVIYTDTMSLVNDTSTWANCCSFSEDSLSLAYEGKKSYRFDYQIIEWFAGAGMNLDDWNRIPSYDISHCKSVRFAYRGLAAGHKLYLQLKEGDNVSTAVEAGAPSDTFTTVNAALSSFSDINLALFKEVIFGVSGPQTGNGTVWIDAVEIVY